MDAELNGCMPANPCQARDQNGEFIAEMCAGLTKRERLAMAAMQGICAGSAHGNQDYERIARLARSAADALLAELAKEQP